MDHGLQRLERIRRSSGALHNLDDEVNCVCHIMCLPQQRRVELSSDASLPNVTLHRGLILATGMDGI